MAVGASIHPGESAEAVEPRFEEVVTSNLPVSGEGRVVEQGVQAQAQALGAMYDTGYLEQHG